MLFLIDTGIQQFRDLGSGISAVGNVPEVARAESPETPVASHITAVGRKL